MKKSYVVFKVIGYILLALQVFSMLGNVMAMGGYYFLELFARLFFMDGVPGFFYSIGQFFALILAIIFFSIAKKKKKKYMIWEVAQQAKDPSVPSWVCVQCNTVNLETANECINCGTAKAYSKKRMARQQANQ